MSRGPGIWQRRVLGAVAADGGWHALRSLLPPAHTRAEVNALNRAAHRLAAAGQVRVFYYCDTCRTEVGPPGPLRQLARICDPCRPGGAWYPCSYTRAVSGGYRKKATSTTYGGDRAAAHTDRPADVALRQEG